MLPQPAASQIEAAQWKPLTAKQRRVLGTLMEKSKTTPDAYPMTITALTTGCNQKTNRSPITNLSSEQVEKLIDELRALGTLTIVQGSGRVEKIRHYAYQWLGVSKVEAAVITELLLRGEQTVGELRGRAARMEPIADLSELEAILQPLIERKLVIELTPPGRGQIVSHNLYEEWELRELGQKISNLAQSSETDETSGYGDSKPTAQQQRPSEPSQVASLDSSVDIDQMMERIVDLEQQLRHALQSMTAIQNRLAHLETELGVSPVAENQT